MKILTQSGARHFCQGFSGNSITAKDDVEDYVNRAGTQKSFSEGKPEFDELRDCLIRESERYAFLSAASYAASLRTLRASGVSWSIVGMYYSSFFAAKSLLAMHGGWFGNSKQWIEVTNAQPGSLEITLSRKIHPLLTGRGSHKHFWVVFYSAVRPLNSYVSASEAYAIQPVHSSPTWLIDNRNKVNYRPAHAINLLEDFVSRLDVANIPGSFPGDLKVFLNIANAMQTILRNFRSAHLLNGDVFASNYANLVDAVNALVRIDREAELDDYADQSISSIMI